MATLRREGRGFGLWDTAQGPVLSVLCGQVVPHYVSFVLNDEERALIAADESQLARMAEAVRRNPRGYDAREIAFDPDE